MAPAPSLTELIQTVNDRSADEDALTRVAAAAEVSGEITNKADLLLGHFVEAARHDGRSWAEIGAALGVTKQGAQQRFVDRDAATAAPDDQLLVRYTSRARASVARARDEAREMGHNYVGTEHLLLGVLTDPGALSVRVLEGLGIPIDQLRQAVVEAAVPRPPNAVVAADVPFTPRARRVLDLTRGESLRLGHNYIGTEHLLLALTAEQDGIGGRVLRDRGVDADRARAELIRLLTAYVESSAR
ncbi:MAG TPA: Clp protease N-terminal domain-containing protein [Acidimicrobiia bacterium]